MDLIDERQNGGGDYITLVNNDDGVGGEDEDEGRVQFNNVDDSSGEVEDDDNNNNDDDTSARHPNRHTGRHDDRESAQGKIFVGGVSWETTEEIFSKHFEKYGEIVDSVIMKEKHTRRPRGFGFITFSDPSVIDKVLEDEHVINGRTVEVKRTVPREDMEVNKGEQKTKKIFVGGIPPSVTEDELKEYFSSFGNIIEHQIMLEHGTGRSRGFGFVTFESEDVVDSIVNDGKAHELGGKQVEIKKAEPKRGGGSEARSRYGSGYPSSYGSGGGSRAGSGYGGRSGRGYGEYGRGYGASAYNSYDGYSGFGYRGAGTGFGGSMYGGGEYGDDMYGNQGGYAGAYGGAGYYGGYAGAYGATGGYGPAYGGAGGAYGGGSYGSGGGGSKGYGNVVPTRGRYHPYGK